VEGVNLCVWQHLETAADPHLQNPLACQSCRSETHQVLKQSFTSAGATCALPGTGDLQAAEDHPGCPVKSCSQWGGRRRGDHYWATGMAIL
jgi:hypothetical protein